MRHLLCPLVLLLVVVGLSAQGNTRKLTGAAGVTKHLTHDQIDRWIFQGEKNETIIVCVTSGEFDPVIQLVRKGGAELTAKIDDEGSSSRFRVRLPAAGEYHVRVHAYKQRGGGNYRIEFERFAATPIKVGARITGTIPKSGRAHHYFGATQGEILIPEVRGGRVDWSVRDVRGAAVHGWQKTVPVAATGEHVMTIRGEKDTNYSLILRRARRHDLRSAGSTGTLPESGMDIWRFNARPGEFRSILVSTPSRLESRLVRVNESLDERKLRLAGRGESLPDFTVFPAGSKGNTIRWFALFHRRGTFELQLLAHDATKYQLGVTDPTLALSPAAHALMGRIVVGGTAFFAMKLDSGTMVNLGVSALGFDPTIRLYGPRGDLLEENDDGGDHLDSAITYLVKRRGRYLLQVSSVGNGGGGEFKLRSTVTRVPALAVGESVRGEIGAGASAYWSFSGSKDRTIIVSAQSRSCDVNVEIIGADGVLVAKDDDHGIGTDSLLAVRLPADGRYILKVGSSRGRGDYRVRLIGDEDR